MSPHRRRARRRLRPLVRYSSALKRASVNLTIAAEGLGLRTLDLTIPEIGEPTVAVVLGNGERRAVTLRPGRALEVTTSALTFVSSLGDAY